MAKTISFCYGFKVINYNYIPIFTALYETLSFSDAAARLRMAQPAVSRSIKSLEQQLGQQLFLRTNKMVVPTAVGESFYQKIKGPFIQLEEECLNISSNQEIVKGTLKIGSLRELGEHKLGELFHRFLAAFPQVELEIHYAGNKELAELLKLGKLDFYFGITAFPNENLRTYKLFKQKSYLVTSSDTHLPKQFVAKDLRFIGYRHNDPLIQNYFTTFYPNSSVSNLKQVFTVNSHKTMVEILCQNKDLFAVMPEFSDAFVQNLKSGRLKKVRHHSLAADCYFAYWEKQFPSSAETNFIHLAKSIMS